jgi:HEAT repeat protein
MAALKALSGGSYSTALNAWGPILEHGTLAKRSLAERRATFVALEVTTGEAAVALLRPLLTRSAWIGRARKEEMAALAAEALWRIGTPAAIAALQAGARRINRAIRRACREALGTLVERTS